MRSHRCHSSTTAYKNHFRISFFCKELTKWTKDRHFVTRLLGKQVRGHLAWLKVSPRGWRRDTNVELHDPLFLRVIRHRIGPDYSLVHRRYVVEDPKFIPIVVVFLFDINLFVVNYMRLNLKLYVTACAKVDLLTFG